jgi:uncharacterized membrane protein YecN with MAPEG domain
LISVPLAAHSAALWAGLNLLLLLVLSVRVVRLRRKHRVAMGHGDVPELAQAVRAFGNATEYVPAGLIGLALLAIDGAQPWLVHAAGLVFFVGRAAHAWALSRSGEASLLRAMGVLTTWLVYIAIGVALIFYAVP